MEEDRLIALIQDHRFIILGQCFDSQSSLGWSLSPYIFMSIFFGFTHTRCSFQRCIDMFLKVDCFHAERRVNWKYAFRCSLVTTDLFWFPAAGATVWWEIVLWHMHVYCTLTAHIYSVLNNPYAWSIFIWIVCKMQNFQSKYCRNENEQVFVVAVSRVSSQIRLYNFIQC